jgi:hypothetical protein
MIVFECDYLPPVTPGRCSGSSGRRGKSSVVSWGRGWRVAPLWRRPPWRPRASAGPAVAGLAPGSGQAPGDGNQPQTQRLGFGHPSGPDNDSVWVQVSRSQARRTMASQTALDAASWNGRLARADVFDPADATPAGARRRSRSFRSGMCQPLVFVAKQVIRRPLHSTGRSCAPGRGTSRRAMTRARASHPVRFSSGSARARRRRRGGSPSPS